MSYLKELLNKRNSIRRYSDKSIDTKLIDELLWAGYGQAKLGRTVPSAGACYPLKLHAIKKEEGFSYFNAPVCIIITVDYERITKRYGRRGYRYAHIEAGHVAQNITLRAIELGLGTVMIGAFRDGRVKKLLKTEYDPLYIIPVGKEV